LKTAAAALVPSFRHQTAAFTICKIQSFNGDISLDRCLLDFYLVFCFCTNVSKEHGASFFKAEASRVWKMVATQT
jgi:hypothetical protein